MKLDRPRRTGGSTPVRSRFPITAAAIRPSPSPVWMWRGPFAGSLRYPARTTVREGQGLSQMSTYIYDGRFGAVTSCGSRNAPPDSPACQAGRVAKTGPMVGNRPKTVQTIDCVQTETIKNPDLLRSAILEPVLRQIYQILTLHQTSLREATWRP